MIKNIVTIDDQIDMQVLYKAVFRKYENYQIVAQFSDGESALEEIFTLLPDLIIIDITLPGMGGLELTRILHKRLPKCKLLVVTGHDRERFLWKAREIGANDLIMKGDTKELFQKINELLN